MVVDLKVAFWKMKDVMAQSIPSPPIPSLFLYWALSGIFSLLLPHGGGGGGALPKKVSPGVGHSQKQISLSDFEKKHIASLQQCQYLHNCFHLQTRDDKKENVHGT